MMYLTKRVNINSTKFFHKPYISPIRLLNVFEVIAGILLIVSFFNAAITVHSLLDHLFERTTLPKKSEKSNVEFQGKASKSL